MYWTRGKQGFTLIITSAVFVCILMTVFMLDMGQAAPPATGLERHQKAGLVCQSCHKETPPQTTVPGAQCMDCHGDLAKLIEKSSKAIPNPHSSPHISPGETPKCEECHHIHNRRKPVVPNVTRISSIQFHDGSTPENQTLHRKFLRTDLYVTT